MNRENSIICQRNKVDWLLLLLSVSLVISSVAGFFYYGSLYYIVLTIIGISFFFKPTIPLVWGIPQILLFLFACFLSLLFNDTPSYFNAWARFCVYVLVLLVVSPIITNRYIGGIRSRVFYYSLCVLSLLSIGSFFAYFLGINYFVREGVELEIEAGRFSGLMNHSMVLGPFAAMSSVYLFARFLSEKKKIAKLVFIIGSALCMGASLLAASRIALAAGLTALIVMLLRYYKDNISKSLAFVLFIMLIGTSTFPIWGGLTDFLVSKQQANAEMGGGLLASRQRKITARIKEFKGSPIVGIGFCTVDPRYDVVQYDNGQIEPGSSWLAVASMTGIIGFVSFFSVIVMAFRKAWKIRDKKAACILSSILSFYLTHMLAEGYIMAPRSFLGMFFWLLLGVISFEFNKERYRYNNS